MADVIRCPIKINLILRVFSKLPNGYHEIYSLFWQKTAAERLTIRPKYDEIIGDSLNIEGMKIEGENLVTKALAAARKRAEIPPLDVELEKFFPAGSGIGAGSGNAGIGGNSGQSCGAITIHGQTTGEWISLGEYDLRANTPAYVEFDNGGDVSGTLYADAVLVVPKK